MAKKAAKRVTTPKRAANTATAKKTEAAKKKTEAAKKKTENDEKPIDKNKSDDQSELTTSQIDEKSEKAIDEQSKKQQEAKADDPDKDDEEENDGEENPDEKMEVESETKTQVESSVTNADDSASPADKPDESIEETDNNESTPLNILTTEDEDNLLLSSGEENDHKDSKSENVKDESIDLTNEETQQKEDGEQKEEPKTENASECDKKGDETNTDSKANDDKNQNKSTQQGRNLWVSNLLRSTRAQELKHILSRYGKVIGAKIVQSSRNPRTRCYGYVTMESTSAADRCIKKLNNTELKGQIIQVAKVRPENSLPSKSSSVRRDNRHRSKHSDKRKRDEKEKIKEAKTEKKSDENKTEENQTETEKNVADPEKKKDEKIKKDSKERDAWISRSSSRKGPSVDKAVRREKRTDILPFDKIREERDRALKRKRALREEEKRRREMEKCREIDRNQQYEARRLEREREKLRLEREHLDKQRQVILRLERERQRMERDRLEREREELRRQQMRLEEVRRPMKRPVSMSFNNYRREVTGYPDDRKRQVREGRHYEEPPPPPRFDVTPREATREPPKKEMDKEYKTHVSYPKHDEEYPKRNDYNREFPPKERHYPTSHMEEPNGTSEPQYVNHEREIREQRRDAIPPSGPPKLPSDVEYHERANDHSPVPFQNHWDDQDRHQITEHHPKLDNRPLRNTRDHRYGEPPLKEAGRFRDWHSSGPCPPQPFMDGPRDSWSKSDSWRAIGNPSERWAGNNSSRFKMSGNTGPPYSSGNSSGLSCPPPPGNGGYSMDRFGNYKPFG